MQELQTDDRSNIWKTHMGLFITVLVLVAISMIVMIVFVVYRRLKHSSVDRVSIISIQPATASESALCWLGSF